MKTKNLTKTIAILTVAFITGLFLQSCKDEKAPTQAELEGNWVLKSINGQEAGDAFKSALPTLTFNFQDSLVTGNAGCNRYVGNFTYDKGKFSAPALAATRMLCMEDNKENEFLADLSNEGNTLSIKNEILHVSRDGKVVLEFIKDAGTQNAEPAKAQIDPQKLDGEWTLLSMNGEAALKNFDKGTIPTLNVDLSNNKVSGNSGCNTYNGGFSVNDDQLVVGKVMLTRMSCPDMFYENEYIKALSDTSTIAELNDKVLKISKNGTPILEFVKIVTDSIAQ